MINFKFISLLGFIFIFTIVIIDIILSFAFEKEVYLLQENKISIIAQEKSLKQVDWSEVGEYDNTPFWEAEYRGPFMNYDKQKKKKCRIVGLGDSIIWGSGVSGKETYLYSLQEKVKNTEILNFGIPGSDLLQQIIKYKKEGIDDKNDLLIWHIWEDDGKMYKQINGVLYDASIELNSLGSLFLFPFIPDTLNQLLIQWSYLYNQTLLIKYNQNIQSKPVDNLQYVLKKFDDFLNKELKNNKKILIIFSPSLKNQTYKNSLWSMSGYPKIYMDINKMVADKNNVETIFLDNFLKSQSVEDIRYDDCCHFNEKGHTIIAEQLHEYIKNNNLLNEECY